ncbi:MAG: hypothetical protein GX620_09980 [Chloroflexi bacterium]|nr:hypothetical protein [Chloroflexota bacterium]
MSVIHRAPPWEDDAMDVLRDVAVILLAVETLILALVPLALVGGVVYAVYWLLRRENLPSWLKLLHAYLDLARGYVELLMALIIRPIVVVNSTLATVRGWLTGIAERRSR